MTKPMWIPLSVLDDIYDELTNVAEDAYIDRGDPEVDNLLNSILEFHEWVRAIREGRPAEVDRDA